MSPAFWTTSQINSSSYLWLARPWSLIGLLLISWVIGSWCSLLLEKVGRVNTPRNAVVLWRNHCGAWGEHLYVIYTYCTTDQDSTLWFEIGTRGMKMCRMITCERGCCCQPSGSVGIGSRGASINDVRVWHKCRSKASWVKMRNSNVIHISISNLIQMTDATVITDL